MIADQIPLPHQKNFSSNIVVLVFHDNLLFGYFSYIMLRMPPKGTGRKTTTRKRKNEIESESSPKTTSQKRSKSEVESESSSTSVRRSERIAAQPKRDRQDSDLARIIQELNLTSYGLPSSASGFKNKDIDTMKVIFQGASAENVVIPDAESTSYIKLFITNSLSKPSTYNLSIL